MWCGGGDIGNLKYVSQVSTVDLIQGMSTLYAIWTNTLTTPETNNILALSPNRILHSKATD